MSRFENKKFPNFMVDVKSPRLFAMDAEGFLDHVAWRIAHFYDENQTRTWENFTSFMEERSILVRARGDILTFAPDKAPKYAFKDALISNEATLSVLMDYLEGTPFQISKDAILIDETPKQDNLALFVKTKPEYLSERNALIKNAREIGFDGMFKEDMLSNSVLCYKLSAANFDNQEKKWIKTPYTKTYTRIGVDADGNEIFTRQNNPQSRSFIYEPFESRSISEFIDKVYHDGGVVVSGKPVFHKEFVGQRIMYTQIDEVKSDSNGKKFVPQGVKRSLEQAYGKIFISGYLDRDIDVLTMPNILPHKPTYIPVDVDGLTFDDGVDFFTDREKSWKQIEERLPAPFKGVRCTMMLSSSAGMQKDDEGEEVTYTAKKLGNPLSFRLWYEMDRPINIEHLGEYLSIVAPEIEADVAVYRYNQAIYGNPLFKNSPDPLGGERYLTFNNENKVKLSYDDLYNDIEAHKQLYKDHYDKIQRIRLERKQSFQVTLPSGDLTPIDKSRIILSEKLKFMGDPAGMESVCDKPNHYDFVKHCVYSHIATTLEEFPFEPKLSYQDLVNPPDSFVGREISWMHEAFYTSMADAINNPNTKTQQRTLKEYGLTDNGPIKGKYLDELRHAYNTAFLKVQRNLENEGYVTSKTTSSAEEEQKKLRKRVRSFFVNQSVSSKDDLLSYLANCTEIVFNSLNNHILRVEKVTNLPLLQIDGKLLLLDPELGKNMVLSPTPDKSFVFAPLLAGQELPEKWEIADSKNIMDAMGGKAFLYNVPNIEHTLRNLPTRKKSPAPAFEDVNIDIKIPSMRELKNKPIENRDKLNIPSFPKVKISSFFPKI